jgi:hypothetical protein
MQPVSFSGSSEIKKPASMTDEQCMSVWAKRGFIELTNIMEEMELRTIPPHDINFDEGTKCIYFLTAWKPSYEDLQALNRGEPIYIKTLSEGLPPMAVYTFDENGNCNDAV